jgi:hypothetical protein
MADAVDPLLNDAVDFYIQAIDYCQIRQARFRHWSVLEFEKLCRNLANGRIPNNLAGILDGSGQFGRDPPRTARSRATSRDLARTACNTRKISCLG